MCEAVLQAFDFVSLIQASMKRGHVHSCSASVCVGVHVCLSYQANEYRANDTEVIMWKIIAP